MDNKSAELQSNRVKDEKSDETIVSISSSSPILNYQKDSGSEIAPLLSSAGSSYTCDDDRQKIGNNFMTNGSPLKNGSVIRHSQTSDLDDWAGSLIRFKTEKNFTNSKTYNSFPTTRPKKIPRLLLPNKRHSLPSQFDSNKYNNGIDSEKTMLLEDNAFGKENNLMLAYITGQLPSDEDDHLMNDNEDTKPKQSSLVTIFSVWNTILCSSMLTIPWGIYMAGFIPALILILLMSALCLFTAYKLLQVHKFHGGGEKIEVMELVKALLGNGAEYISRVSSIIILLGTNIAYWILMSNFLYNSVNFFYDVIFEFKMPLNSTNYNAVLCPKEDPLNKSTLNTDVSYDNLGPYWDLYQTVPLFLALLVFPLLNFRTVTFFTKFNSLGTVAILYLVVFVFIKSVSWGINMDETERENSFVLRSTFPVLAGMLSLSFFIHNIIITIMKSNRNQSKNARDLTIAYALVTITYIFIGVVFYICFPLAKMCIEDNILNNFQKGDGLTVGARTLLLFQLFTVYPLIAYMLRTQLLTAVFKTTEVGTGLVVLVNIVIVTICVLFAVFLPHIGTIIRYTGAISGSIYVFTLPSLLHLMVSYKKGTMTVCKILFYLCVPIIGILILLSQFFIETD